MTEKTPETRAGIRRTIVVIVAFIGLTLGMITHKLLSPRVLSSAELAANGVVVFDKPRAIADFELVDETGRPFTLEDLQGQWSLVFFGFTTCPDICPTTLATLARWQKTLDKDIAAETQVVMVSVDPARDTPERLQPYIDYFDEKFIGVTGDFLPIKRLADNLNVAFNKVPLGDDYTVDHSGYLLLINPKGHYHGFIRPPFELARLKLTYQSIVTQF